MSRGRKNGRHWLVKGVNLGDGELVKCRFSVKDGVVTVRQYQSRTRVYAMDMVEVAGIVARQVQVRRCAA
jgi:hypothetical protein